MKRIVRRSIQALLACSMVSLMGCAQLGQLAWQAADQASRYGTRPRVVPEIQAAEGFRVVRVAAGFNFPSAMTWDAEGRMYVLESHTVPVPFLKPRILRIDTDGRIRKVRLEGAVPQGTSAIGLAFNDGWLYFSQEESDATFSISRVRPEGGVVETVLGRLPTQGDHDVNHLVFDAQGNLYFGIGSATNSGVVSASDPVNQKWLKAHPQTYELPCRDIELTRQTFREEVEGKVTVTGAFQPHGQSGAGEVKGQVPCMGAVFVLRRGSKKPELLGWGMRNPVAIAVSRDGEIYVGMQGADMRSSRPILNDPDAVYRIEKGRWYGWPDFSASLEPINSGRHRVPDEKPLEFVIDHARSGLEPPSRSLLLTATEPHAAVCGLAILPEHGPFARWDGQFLIAEMGDFKPMTDSVHKNERAGFQVELVDRSGQRSVFLRNRGEGDSEPASTLDLENGLERPVDVRVGPDGLVYVLDYGAFVTSGAQPKVFPKTGKVFRIEPVR